MSNKQQQSSWKETLRKYSLSFTQTAISLTGALPSPFTVFKKYANAAVSFLFLAILGGIFAYGEGALVPVVFALLFIPTLLLGIIATLLTPMFRIAARVMMHSKIPMILRPVYDYIILLSIGLPWALVWFWEGKVFGLAIMAISSVPLNYLGYALAGLILAAAFSAVLVSLLSVSRSKVPKELSAVYTLLSSSSMTIAFVASAMMIVLFLVFFGFIMRLNVIKLIDAVGVVMSFYITLSSLDTFRKMAPTIRHVPLTWNVMALIIGFSALQGDYFILSITAVAVFLLILYVVSRDGMWLWYALIAVPSAPAVAYYLGFITKVILDTYSVIFAKILGDTIITLYLSLIHI